MVDVQRYVVALVVLSIACVIAYSKRPYRHVTENGIPGAMVMTSLSPPTTTTRAPSVSARVTSSMPPAVSGDSLMLTDANGNIKLLNYQTLLDHIGKLRNDMDAKFGLVQQDINKRATEIDSVNRHNAAKKMINEKRDLKNGAYTFAVQGDGNLVLYHKGRAIWTKTSYKTLNEFKSNDYRFTLQGDGNVVLYYKSKPVWATDTVHWR